MSVGGVQCLIETGVARGFKSPLKLALTKDGAERLAGKSILGFDVADFSRIVNAEVAIDMDIAHKLSKLGLIGKVKPQSLKSLDGYGKVFTENGALTEDYAGRFLEENAANKEASILRYMSSPNRKGLKLIMDILDAFRTRYFN